MVARTGGLFGIALSALALYFTARIASADWLSKDATREAILGAIRMVPDNWQYYRDWGEFVPADGVVALSGAVTRNPRNPAVWLELAEALEKTGRYGEAEQSLRTAVDLDRGAGPRRLLAEFYFRRGDRPKFWPAANDTLRVAESSPKEIFEECWRLSQDSAFLRQEVIPERAGILADYLEWLIETAHWEPAELLAQELMRDQKPVGRLPEVMMKYCGGMLDLGRVVEASAAWRWLRNGAAVDGAGWVTDGDWAREDGPPWTWGHGFGWRITGAAPTEYVPKTDSRKSGELRIRFSGKQPERCELVSEYVALWPGRNYRLQARYETRGIGAESGLKWRVVLADGRALGEVEMPGGGLEERSVRMEFSGPATPAVGRLALTYERVTGTVRIEGVLTMRRVDGS